MVETGTDQAVGSEEGARAQHLPSPLLGPQEGGDLLQLLPPGQQGGQGALGYSPVTRPWIGHVYLLSCFNYLLLLLPLLLPIFHPLFLLLLFLL